MCRASIAQETVAAYEAKYNRLKSRYRELTELHSEEVDKLHDEINTLQERVVELEALAAQLEAARWVPLLSRVVLPHAVHHAYPVL